MAQNKMVSISRLLGIQPYLAKNGDVEMLSFIWSVSIGFWFVQNFMFYIIVGISWQNNEFHRGEFEFNVRGKVVVVLKYKPLSGPVQVCYMLKLCTLLNLPHKIYR